MKKFLLVSLCFLGVLLLPGLSRAQNKIGVDLACKIGDCLTRSLKGGAIGDDCENPLEVFFLQVPGTNKARFLASLGYDYDPRTDSVLKKNDQNKKPLKRAYNAKTGKFELIPPEEEAIPKTPREELLSSCPSCSEDDMSAIIKKYGETNRMPDLITQSDTACEGILCLGGLAMGADGGQACMRSILKYKSLLIFNSNGFDPSGTASKRRSWLNKCGQPGTGGTINQIQDSFGPKESF